MSENMLKKVKRMIGEIAFNLKAKPMFKNNLTPIDEKGNVVAFRFKNGVSYGYSVADIMDYATLGCTN